MTNGPVLIDLEDKEPAPSVSDAPPVPDPELVASQGQAMQAAARLAGRRWSGLARWFWSLLAVLLGAFVSMAAWDFVSSLIARVPVLGWAVAGVFGALVLVMLAIAVSEVAALSRLTRIDGLRRAADRARADQDLSEARNLTNRLLTLYASRPDTAWARDRLAERRDDVFDADAQLDLVEHELLAPLDDMAKREVETAARQVATVTALVPLALADIATALAANLRMIRAIAEIYGGRSGTLGNWRLTRTVFAHLVATGAMAAADDLVEPLLGGSILSKLSRRFGEGLVNGALTARVGVAAMEVCRPLPFGKKHQPSARKLVKRALAGLFSSGNTSSDRDPT